MDAKQEVGDKIANLMQKEFGQFDYIRKLQANMYSCCAKCSNNSANSHHEDKQCYEDCAKPFQNAKKFIENQSDDLKRQLTLCKAKCGDLTVERGWFRTREKEINDELLTQIDNCVVKCGENLLESIPKTAQKIKDYFKKEHNL